MRLVARAAAPTPTLAELAAVGAMTCSINEFQLAQNGHLPKYWADSAPHSLQTYSDRGFAILIQLN